MIMAAPSRRLRSRLDALRGLRSLTRGDVAAWLADQWEAETRARSAFFLVPIGLMIGVAMTDGAGLRIGFVPVLAATLAMFAWAHRTGGRGFAGGLVLLIAFVLAGMALAIAEIRWTGTTIFSGEATVRIEGRVTWRDRDERDRMRYLVRIERTERPVLSRPPEIASILVSSRHEPIQVGGRFQGLVRLRAPSGPAYPGAHDFAFTPFFDGRGANGFALGPPEPSRSEVVAPTVGERLVRLRLWMSDRIRAVIGGGAGAVASALITGERSGIPDDIDGWLRATGLSHVLSISGLHMALVAGFAMLLVRGLLAAIPGAALTLPTKKIAAVAALVVATAYLVISGSDVATDRSYVMLSIMLVAILVDRPALTLRNVAIAAIVVIVTTPHAVVTASFQMSFSATAALVGVYGAISRHRARRAGQSGRRPHPVLAVLLFLAGLAASSAIAGTATAPYAAYHFQRVAPYGIIANLIALPLFSFWIMPLALIAVLAMPFGLDAPVLILIGWALELVFATAKVLATHFPDAPSGRLTAAGLLVLTASLLLACLPASLLKWSAVPVAALGLILLPDRSTPPELLIYEDGRELATIDDAGQLHPLRRHPNDFVFDQWARAYAPNPAQERTFEANTRSATLPNVDAPSDTTSIETIVSTAKADPEREPMSQPAISAARASPSIGSRGMTRAPGPTFESTDFTCEDSPFPNDDRSSSMPSAATAPKTRSAREPVPRSASAETAAGRGDDAAPSPNPSQTAPPALGVQPQFSKPDGIAATPAEPNSAKAGKTAMTQSTESTTSVAAQRKPRPARQICRATTRGGLRIVWTDDYRLLGLACDTSDIAIVARAVALRDCRSGAHLVTMRTLRETGSLSIVRTEPGGRPVVTQSITDPDEPWNLHRRAPWPESWRSSEPVDGPPLPPQTK